MEGWIKLHRQVIENGWLKNHSLWILWSYILLKATHTECKVKIAIQKNSGTMTREINLEAGQLMFGRKKAALDTGLSEQNIRTALKHLKCLKNITVESTKNYSIISVVNWTHYQGDNKNQPTANQDLTTYKNDKNILIELSLLLIDSVNKTSSVYSIIKRYENELGKDKLKEILSDCIKRENRFQNENKLAAYLQACKNKNGQTTKEIDLSFKPVSIYGQN